MVHPPRISMWHGHPARGWWYAASIDGTPSTQQSRQRNVPPEISLTRTAYSAGIPADIVSTRRTGKMPMPRIIALLILLACINAGAEPRMIPDDFPRFIVPEHQKQMDSLRALYWLHYQNNGPQATLWDEWLPPATLWPAAGSGEALDDMRRRWSAALSARRIDDEGYASTHQHPGHGHAEGWPFPLWNQSGGIGWQFTFKDEHYRQESGLHTVDQKGFEPRGIEDGGITETDGWRIKFAEPRAALTTPPFQIGAESAVFIKLAWRTRGMDDANPFLEWTTADSAEFNASRRIYFSPLPESRGSYFTMIPVHLSPQWKGKIT